MCVRCVHVCVCVCCVHVCALYACVCVVYMCVRFVRVCALCTCVCVVYMCPADANRTKIPWSFSRRCLTVAISIRTEDHSVVSLPVEGQTKDSAPDVVPTGERYAWCREGQLDDLPVEVKTVDTHKAGDCQLYSSQGSHSADLHKRHCEMHRWFC